MENELSLWGLQRFHRGEGPSENHLPKVSGTCFLQYHHKQDSTELMHTHLAFLALFPLKGEKAAEFYSQYIHSFGRFKSHILLH